MIHQWSREGTHHAVGCGTPDTRRVAAREPDRKSSRRTDHRQTRAAATISSRRRLRYTPGGVRVLLPGAGPHVLTIEAIYENGVLKPARPLPAKEHETVRITIEPQPSWA